MQATDPRSPEVDLWLSSLKPSERLIMLIAMCEAFPVLRHNAAWKRRIEATRGELDVTVDEYADALRAARRIGERLVKELEGTG
jgi:hypothetical protein